jgi:hypothetical protein
LSTCMYPQKVDTFTELNRMLAKTACFYPFMTFRAKLVNRFSYSDIMSFSGTGYLGGFQTNKGFLKKGGENAQRFENLRTRIVEITVEITTSPRRQNDHIMVHVVFLRTPQRFMRRGATYVGNSVRPRTDRDRRRSRCLPSFCGAVLLSGATGVGCGTFQRLFIHQNNGEFAPFVYHPRHMLGSDSVCDGFRSTMGPLKRGDLPHFPLRTSGQCPLDDKQSAASSPRVVDVPATCASSAD